MSSVLGKKASETRSRPISLPYLQSIHNQLEEQVELLYLEEETTNLTLSYQRLYSYVEFLCRDKNQSLITSSLYFHIDHFISACIKSHSAKMQGSESPADVMTEFIRIFDIIESKAKITQRIYLYLDRTYLLNHPTKLTIENYSLQSLHLKLFKTSDIGNNIVDSFLRLLNDFRASQNDSEIIINSIGKLRKILKNDNIDLDDVILRSSDAFFQARHIEIINDSVPEERQDKIYQQIQSEIHLWESCPAGKPSFLHKIKHNAVILLLLSNFETDCFKIARPLLDSKRYHSLSQFFKMLNNAPPGYMSAFFQVWTDYVKEYTLEIIAKNSQDVVDKLVKTKKHFNTIVEHYLCKNPDAEFKLRESFQSVLDNSEKSSSTINQLVKYLDSFFKAALPQDHNENLSILRDVFTIFKSIKSKELFVKLYQKAISKRLIMKTTKDMKLELEFLDLLASEVGIDESRPLLTMLSDIEKSEKYEKDFPISNKAIDFHPLVLNSQAWPLSKTTCKLPADLSDILSEFQGLYLKGKTQKLQWSPGLSYMTINSVFGNSTKELHVSTFQGIVLLLFNEFDELSYSEIKEKAGLDSKTLSSILYSLSMGRHKILLKVGDTSYKVNDAFQEKKNVIKIKQIQMRLKTDPMDDDIDDLEEEEVSYDRDDSIKAFIVRQLKSEKQLPHKDVVYRVLEKYIVQTSDIKRIIDQLISQEYIKRVNNDIYQYIP